MDPSKASTCRYPAETKVSVSISTLQILFCMSFLSRGGVVFSRKQSEVVTNSSLPLKQLVLLVLPVHESFLVVCSSCQERNTSELDIHIVP